MTEQKDVWTTAYVGLGSNVGDRRATLAEAIQALQAEPGIRVDAQSRIYETDPVGYEEQPAFLNMAVRLSTQLAPEDLLGVLLRIEQLMGRTRDIRWGPRTLDLDLLLYGDRSIRTETLTVPHPRMLERAFVLVPLRDVLPDGALPGGVALWAAEASVSNLEALIASDSIALDFMNAVSLQERLEILQGKEGVRLWIE